MSGLLKVLPLIALAASLSACIDSMVNSQIESEQKAAYKGHRCMENRNCDPEGRGILKCVNGICVE